MSRFIPPVLVVAAALTVPSAAFAGQPSTQALTPPPPAFESCQATGTGTLCQGTRTLVEDPVQTDLVCGSGPTAFPIWDQGTVLQRAARHYDLDGNLTDRLIHDRWIDAHWSNPATGRIVTYTQNSITKDRLAVPGDITSSTVTATGETILRAGTGTGAPVLIAAGRQVYNWDGSDLLSSSGRNAFVAAFFQGDSHAFDQVCAALG